jgi:hypothetical protein
MVDSQSVEFSSPHTVPPFQQALARYLEKYPKHERAQYVAGMLMQILSQLETPSTEPLLKKLAENPNEQIAAQAKAVLQGRQFMLELKKKPFDLKFTAWTGRKWMRRNSREGCPPRLLGELVWALHERCATRGGDLQEASRTRLRNHRHQPRSRQGSHGDGFEEDGHDVAAIL